MPDQELEEGAQVEEESQELAVPEISTPEPEVQQPSPAPAGVTEERLRELLESQRAALEEAIDRKVQSTKDRRIGKLESRVEELLALRQEVEAAGGWDPVINQQQQAEVLEARLNKILDARLSQAPASQPARDPKVAWQAEWDAESRKILDAASKLGATLSTEEYNAALFGKKFDTKGDAYAALNQAIYRKMAGNSVPTGAVATEGGDVARPPEPKTPKNFRQNLDAARKKGDNAEARRILDAQWASVEKEQAKVAARQSLEQAGIDPKELVE